MYHSRWKGNHYEAGFKYGNRLKKNNIGLKLNERLNDKKISYGKGVLNIYRDFYPEIIDEIQGFADGLKEEFDLVFAFLTSMYVFTYNNYCSIIAIKNEDEILFARNSDFSIDIEKLCDCAYYKLDNGYSFIGNTTAMIEIEDGVNSEGLACGLTFVYPKIKGYGFNAGFIIRYILEKCKDIDEAINFLKNIPMGSSQNIILADKKGNIALVECNSESKEIIVKSGYGNASLFRTNHFVNIGMEKYLPDIEDEIHSFERYETLKNQDYNGYGIEEIFKLLKGDYGFLCQYDRKKGMDTIWSSVYDLKRKNIYICEGNPKRKCFKLDKRLKFNY